MNRTAWAGAMAQAAAWNYGSFLAGKGLAFLSTVLLARLLVPDDFGLLALGLVVVNYLDAFGDLGMGAALIYRQRDPDRDAPVAFAFSLATGLALGAITFLSAPLVAAFFHEPRALPIVQALSVTFPIASLSSVHRALLIRDLNFRRRFLPEFGRGAAKGGVAVLLAWLGFGAWSLVWAQLAAVAASTVLYWWAYPWRPRLTFDRQAVRGVLGYGTQMTLVDIVGMIHKNVDYLIVGRRLDAAALGFYTMAFRVPELVILNICYLVSDAVFPGFARLQHDPAGLRTGFLTTLRFVALITVPAGIGLFMVTPEFVQVFYTDRWSAAIPAMQALSLYALIYSLSFNAGDVYKATGRPSILTRIGIVKLAVTVPALWWAAGRGFVYVAVMQAATTLLLTLLRLGIVARVIAIRPAAMLGALRPAAIAALGVLLGTAALRSPIAPLDPILRLATLTLAGVAACLAGLWLVERETLRQAFALVRIPSRLTGRLEARPEVPVEARLDG